MRRPAQHHPGSAARGWAHPYTGPNALAVFYNDGGPGSQPQTPVPTPAEVAARAGQQAPAPVLPPAGQQSPTSDDDQVLLDHRTNAPMTQAAFAKIMARENAKGRRNVLREIAEATGVAFDPDDFDINSFGQTFKEADAARKAQLTEEQRRREELAALEQSIADREAKAQQLAADAARRDRETRVRSALVRLGATGDDLEDAAALLRLADNASDDDITRAAEELKARRSEMFGSAQQQTLPPAPSGGPAGGNAPRQPSSTKDAVRDAARKRAIERGLRAPDAA